MTGIYFIFIISHWFSVHVSFRTVFLFTHLYLSVNFIYYLDWSKAVHTRLNIISKCLWGLFQKMSAWELLESSHHTQGRQQVFSNPWKQRKGEHALYVWIGGPSAPVLGINIPGLQLSHLTWNLHQWITWWWWYWVWPETAPTALVGCLLAGRKS